MRPLVDVRRPVWPDIGTDMPAPGAHHPLAERPDRRVIGPAVRVHGRAMTAIHRGAVHQQVTAAMTADMPQGDGGGNVSTS
jgi:hypothetical protein